MLNGPKLRIVTIDDDPINLKTILNILTPYYDVRPFDSGKTALKFLFSSHVDLVLLDYNMPRMNGFEVMSLLQKKMGIYDLPVLFLTAKDDRDSEVLALEMGAADYLHKPIESKVLLTRVRHQLELQQYRNHLELIIKEKNQDLIQAYNQLKLREDTILNVLAKATDMRDHNTGDHVWRTTEIVRLIIKEILDNPKPGYSLTRSQADDIIRTSKLHDLGKISMPDSILGKQGKLTEKEFKVMQQHPLYGAELLEEFVDSQTDDTFLSIARDIALYHHEKWDGSGYPIGRKGKKIPLSARIVAIAYVYDALLSVRPYKEAYTHEKALNIITRESGRHFDPYLVQLFTKCADAFRNVPRILKSQTSRGIAC